MRVIVAGGRDYRFTDSDTAFLAREIERLGVTEVVTGGAPGADAAAYRWAKAKKLAVKVFLADWDSYGRAAGPIRNRRMAEYADTLIAFPGGRGTNDMIATMQKLGKDVILARSAHELSTDAPVATDGREDV